MTDISVSAEAMALVQITLALHFAEETPAGDGMDTEVIEKAVSVSLFAAP